MITELPDIQDLPRQNASQVKNKWGEVLRQVRQSGSVAITNHSTVDMVLLDADTYQRLTEEIHMLNSRDRNVLDELAHRFEARLEVLEQPDVRQKVEALFETKGKLDAHRPKAGVSF
ncbi:type II toxin-antitoxin system prevent-host-death family antitoxin [Pseudomonas sp. CBC3]|uniref:type II toxin-antitoxin system prevent-host-death family antitoxin n=1 Tax=Pseudomonas sp. CBC3 TaxID=3123318 RepID=UPI0030EACB77